MKQEFSTPVNLTKAMKSVNLEDLKSSGETNYLSSLQVGDTIQFPSELNELKLWVDVMKSGAKVYKIGILYNGKSVALPVAAFRRCPYTDKEKFMKKNPVNGDLILSDNDYTRVTSLIGKTLKITSMFNGDAVRFSDNRPVMKEDGSPELRSVKFAIFAIV